jgi:hypothetical protein
MCQQQSQSHRTQLSKEQVQSTLTVATSTDFINDCIFFESRFVSREQPSTRQSDSIEVRTDQHLPAELLLFVK